MPYIPTFDYYQELEVEDTATIEDITSAYRRLARVHHPDRNHGQEAEATIKFQQLQKAYEVLSNSTERDRYDISRNRQRPFFSDLDEDEDNKDEHDDDSDGLCPCPDYRASRAYSFFEQLAARSEFYRLDPSSPRAHAEARRAHNEERQRFQARQEEAQDRLRQFYAQQAAAAEKRREEREKQRQHKQQEREQEREQQFGLERQLQEKRWEEQGATTPENKARICLHSDFCAKMTLNKKKVKCFACSAKRGMIMFECPYCLALLCQLCVSNFSARRQKLSKSEETNKAASSPEETASETDSTAA